MADIDHQDDELNEAHERFVLPLVVPALIFLFAVLVVYGLSRIYIDLNGWHYKDVTMATPVALGVALFILLFSAYMASRRPSGAVVGLMIVLALAALTAGATWAAVHDEERPLVKGEPTPPNGTPLPAGTVSAALSEFKIEVNPTTAPGGTVTFHVTNGGTTIHNFHVIKTDAAPDALPIDSSGFSVDLTQVDNIANTEDLDIGASDDLPADLAPGKYVLICNVPSHYQSGMHTEFEAGPPAPGGGGAPPPP